MPETRATGRIEGDDRGGSGSVGTGVDAEAVVALLCAWVELGRVVGENRPKPGQQPFFLSGNFQRLEKAVRFGDARARRIVHLEVGHQVDAGGQRSDVDGSAVWNSDDSALSRRCQ